MKDIDRNINSVVFSTLSSIIQIIDVSNFNPSEYKLIKQVSANFTNSKADTVLSINIDPGVYYYKHSLRQVTSNNAACLFSLLTNQHYNDPFYSYYAQSPIKTDYLEITTLFWVKQTTQFTVAKSEALSSDFNIAGFIKLYKRNE